MLMNNSNTKTLCCWAVSQSNAENEAIQRKPGKLAQWSPTGTKKDIFSSFHRRRKQRQSPNFRDQKENKTVEKPAQGASWKSLSINAEVKNHEVPQRTSKQRREHRNWLTALVICIILSLISMLPLEEEL